MLVSNTVVPQEKVIRMEQMLITLGILGSFSIHRAQHGVKAVLIENTCKVRELFKQYIDITQYIPDPQQLEQPGVCLWVRLQFNGQFNTLRPWQNVRIFADDNFKLIFLNENIIISIKISLKFVPKGPINNNPALVLIMAWRRPGDKPLSEPMVVRLLTHMRHSASI